MVKKAKQLKYRKGIDTIAYLIVNHPEPLKMLLSDYGVHFKNPPKGKALTNAVLLQLQKRGTKFQKDLEQLIQRLSNPSEDQFLGGLLKGAVGLVGGIISKGKKKRQQRNAASQNNNLAVAQAAQAQRDLEAQRRRLEEERRRREAEERREAIRRQELAEARRVAEAKRKTNMMFAIGGGVALLGIGAMVFMKTNKSPMQLSKMQ